MDDQTFDEPTASAWIRIIEASPSRRDQDIHPKLKSWLSRIQFTKILEIGCGQGISTGQMALLEKNYIGIDASPFLIARAQALYESTRCHFKVSNVYHLDFCDQTFDALFSILVLHLLSDLGTAIAEMARVLKPGGHFLIVTADPDGYEAWMRFYESGKLEGKKFQGELKLNGELSSDTLYFHSRREINLAFADNGLIVGETESFRPVSENPDQNYLISINGYKRE